MPPSSPSNRFAVFRADASAAIGAGHVRRCLALAQALEGEGWRIAFAAGAGSREAVPELAGRGRRVLDLAADEADEAAALAARWPEGCELLVVDHYGRDARFESACRPWARRILAIDDLAGRAHDCDLLVDPSAPGDTEAARPGRAAGCRALLGPAYALLRPEFADLRLAMAARPSRAERPRILISLGATDPRNATGRVLRDFADSPFSADIDVVLGGGAPHLAEVRAAAARLRPEAKVHVEPPRPWDLMAAADLAVGAPGTAAWERACLGLPGVLIVTADNQRGVAARLADAGAAVVLGDAAALQPGAVVGAVAALAADDARRHGMSRRARALCDGLGARRVAAEVDPPRARDGAPVRLRPAAMADAEPMLAWQRHPGTRRFARNPRVPERDEHLAWLAAKLDDPGCILNLVLHHDEAAGVLRLDRLKAGAFEVSIAIAPERHRLGLAAAALALARRLLPEAELRAEVLPENEASAVLFRRAGYEPLGDGWHASRPASHESRRVGAAH